MSTTSQAKAQRRPSAAGSGQPPAQRRGRKRRRTGILLTLGAIFAVSAILRLGQIGEAFGTAPAIAASGAQDADFAGPVAPIRSALDEVERLRDELLRREAEIAERERAVAAAQILVEERLAELEAAEARLSELIAVSDAASETDIDRLTRVYETMEPEAAAPLFAQMEPSFAAGFLARMGPASSAALLAALDPQTAYAISVVLATRNASAPTRAEDAAPETDD
ncbi:MAG: MotE family protein [Pseudomonadota bacterium]